MGAGTGISGDDTVSSDGGHVDNQGGKSGDSEFMGRKFDLGTGDEGGRKAWYVPDERTLFPVKKGMGRIPGGVADSGRGQREREKADVAGREEDERMAERVRGVETGPRLRTRRSLEEEILRIEDDEMRRLTAIAYLS